MESVLAKTLSKQENIIVSQGAAKLRTVKVGGQKKAEILGSRLHFSRFYVVIAAARVRYPAGPNFEGLQFCSPLTYKVM